MRLLASFSPLSLLSLSITPLLGLLIGRTLAEMYYENPFKTILNPTSLNILSNAMKLFVPENLDTIYEEKLDSLDESIASLVTPLYSSAYQIQKSGTWNRMLEHKKGTNSESLISIKNSKSSNKSKKELDFEILNFQQAEQKLDLMEGKIREMENLGWPYSKSKSFIKIFENVFPLEELREIYSFLKTQPVWSFLGQSNPIRTGGVDEARFWYSPLISESEAVLLDKGGSQGALEGPYSWAIQMWRRVQRRIAEELDVSPSSLHLIRLYGNGESFGTGGSPHRDATPSPPHFTFLFYPHQMEDEGEGQGETVFFSPSGRRLSKLIPLKSNRGILFPGNLLHAGRGPGKHGNVLRISLAFKILIDDYQAF